MVFWVDLSSVKFGHQKNLGQKQKLGSGSAAAKYIVSFQIKSIFCKLVDARVAISNVATVNVIELIAHES